MTEIEAIETGKIRAELRRKPIKHIYIRVYPPDGRVVVSAPTRMPMKSITAFLSSKSRWIAKQHERMKNYRQEKPGSYSSGEFHYYEGKKYELHIMQNQSLTGVYISGNSIIMQTGQVSGREAREKILYEWYRERLRHKLPGLLDKWQPIIGVRVSEIRIRRMKTRWGTCNTAAKRIWLNLELAKHTDKTLEYILVHEMTHLLERKHSKRFYSLLDNFLPDWKERKKSMY